MEGEDCNKVWNPPGELNTEAFIKSTVYKNKDSAEPKKSSIYLNSTQHENRNQINYHFLLVLH